jgi:Na+-translocating ferredoxin:NAD+ oxidoreductase RnfD subunit
MTTMTGRELSISRVICSLTAHFLFLCTAQSKSDKHKETTVLSIAKIFFIDSHVFLMVSLFQNSTMQRETRSKNIFSNIILGTLLIRSEKVERWKDASQQ